MTGLAWDYWQVSGWYHKWCDYWGWYQEKHHHCQWSVPWPHTGGQRRLSGTQLKTNIITMICVQRFIVNSHHAIENFVCIEKIICQTVWLEKMKENFSAWFIYHLINEIDATIIWIHTIKMFLLSHALYKHAFTKQHYHVSLCHPLSSFWYLFRLWCMYTMSC